MVAQVIDLATRRKAKQDSTQLLTPQTLLDKQAQVRAGMVRINEFCKELKGKRNETKADPQTR